MNLLKRWWRFNVVGAVGAGVQLGVLAALNRIAPGHYLAETAAAIEITLLHNFLWHVHYTWRDRSQRGKLLRPLVRFHLSNGLVSMTGNLVLMRVLVHDAGLPVVAVNAISIVACSLVNFALGHVWAFGTISAPEGSMLGAEPR